MPLTDKTIQKAKQAARPQRLFDGGGLYLEVSPAGGKWWRLKYRIAGKEKRVSLGVYPHVGLKQARARRDDAKRLLADGIDPSLHRKARRLASVERHANTFEAVAREWHAKYSANWTETHGEKVLARLQSHAFPWLGSRPVSEIVAKDVLAVLRRIESTGTLETAHRVRQYCGQVFRYAVSTGRAERDPTGDLRGALTPLKAEHYASVREPRAIGALLRAIDGFDGSPVTKAALQLAPLTFVRPGELRRAEWKEFDLDRAEWRIPAEKMKMRVPHIVPLSKQAVAALKQLHPLTGSRSTGFVFPGARTNGRPMSDGTINAVLRRLGYSKTEMTGHGFRSMASTHLNEQGWNRDAIERQLAHAERDSVRAAYNFAEHLPERRRMMQSWADYLDGLRSGATVTAIKKSTA